MKLYFIAIVLKADPAVKVKTFKEEVRTRFRVKHALKLPAHITLQPPFKLREEQETDLILSLDSFVRKQRPFDILLDGFDSFPPRVIFVRVANHQPVMRLQNDLLQAINPKLNSGKEISSWIHPHITIASRDLRKEDFPKVWEEFRNREFKASFPVESIFLLKHNGKSWDLHREFLFDK